MAVIEVEGLTKRYGDVAGIDDVSFQVEEGEILGFLGPNGAGKTTTIRTLLGFQRPSSGRATIFGEDIRDAGALRRVRERLGYLPATPSFDETATGREILDLHASIKGGERRNELIDLFKPPLNRKVREYSTGNVQKLAIVQTFMHDPDLVIMDEPTSGLDPLLQQRFNDFIRQERRDGVTVFFSSHILSEVRRVCDRVVILRDGALVTTESISSLLHRSGKAVRMQTTDSPPSAAFDIEGVHNLEQRGLAGGDGGTEVSFTFTGDVNDLASLLDELELREFDVEEAPLEDVFLRFYGGESDA